MWNSILEAMQLGVPVIARRNPGNQSLLLDGDVQCGWLFDDPSTFVDAAVAVVTDAEQTTTLVVCVCIMCLCLHVGLQLTSTCCVVRSKTCFQDNALQRIAKYHSQRAERNAWAGVVCDILSPQGKCKDTDEPVGDS